MYTCASSLDVQALIVVEVQQMLEMSGTSLAVEAVHVQFASVILLAPPFNMRFFRHGLGCGGGSIPS